MPLPYPEVVSVKFLTKPIGLYLHIPFCVKKCAYCDFFSGFSSENMLDRYTESLNSEINKWGGKLNRPIIDTVYFGGGTPSLLGKRIISVMDRVKTDFSVKNNAEITLELNPAEGCEKMLEYAVFSGVNRLSVGAQSGNDKMLSLLGRTHTASQTVKAVNFARKAGINNISLDLMIGLPDSDLKTLKNDLDFILNLNPDHISAYILKIEENTLFYKEKDCLNLPDDDRVSEQYLFMCDYLAKNGYNHYEISNFAAQNKESRHNLKYWNCEEYLGIGASAHSFLNNERFFYERDMKSFLSSPETVFDGVGGDEEEYIMLSLRLKKGLLFDTFKEKYGKDLPDSIKKAALPLKRAGLLNIDNEKISLTDKGMLVSNSIITELLENCL